MSQLPPGFVLDGEAPPSAGGLPAGFQLDAAPAIAKPEGNPGYFATQGQMANESGQQALRGVGQMADAMRFAASGAGRNLTEDTPANRVAGGFDAMDGNKLPLSQGEYEGARKESVQNLTAGFGNSLAGAAGYVNSPINAALRTYAGKPLEDTTGIPKELTEFALGLALPFPKSLPNLSRAEKTLAPTVAELKASYTAAKNAPEVAAAQIKPESMVNAADKLKAELNLDWLDPNLAPKTHYLIDKLTNPPEGATVTMQNVDSARRLLSKMAGRGDEDAAAAMKAKTALDKWMGEIKPADVVAGDPVAAQKIMQEGRGDYSRAMIGEALDQKIAKAERATNQSASGMNLQNQLRQKVNQFLENGDSKGITASERAALESFVKGTATQNTLRFVSNYLGGGGGLGAAVSGAGGFAALGPVGLGLPTVGVGLKMLSNALTSRQASSLSDAIRANSPLGKQMAAQGTKFEQMATDFAVDPNPRNLARLTIASRNLSTNLKDAGINISPPDILKSLQGPVQSRAGNEQQ